jgi:hypothetical protein
MEVTYRSQQEYDYMLQQAHGVYSCENDSKLSEGSFLVRWRVQMNLETKEAKASKYTCLRLVSITVSIWPLPFFGIAGGIENPFLPIINIIFC